MTEKNQSRNYRPGLEVVPGYTLVRPLGSGMAGDVWVARAAGGTLVAVKIVRSLSKLGGRKEFIALKTLRNIRHPNLCPVHGFWTKDANGVLLEDGETQSNLPRSGVATFNRDGKAVNPSESSMKETMAVEAAAEHDDLVQPEGSFPKAEQLIVVMGLGDSTLNDRLMEVRAEAGIAENSLEKVHGLDAAEVIDYLRAASKAIDELNLKHNIYHCDIKPQNILKVGGGIQVCDFGLANRFQGDLRKTQQAFASPAYAAPEVLLGSTYSRTVDQYSLAITYYELRTGVLPFESSTQASVIIAKQHEKLDFNHSSPAERKVLRKATKAEPLERYDTCAEFVSALAIASGVERPSGITAKRAGIGAAVLLALMAGLAYLGFRGDAKSNINGARMSVEGFDTKQRSAQPDAIVTALRLIREASEASPTADQQQEISEFASQWAEKLVAWVFAESENCVSPRWVNGNLADPETESNDPKENQALQRYAETYRNYLAEVEDLYGDDPVLNPVLSADLRMDVTRAHAQLDLITHADRNDKNYQARIATIRNELIHQDETDPDSLFSAVAVALSHYDPHASSQHYLEEQTFDDIAIAQRSIDQAGLESLPDWIEPRWKSMKLQFLEQFKAACESPDPNPATVAAIRKVWPFIASDALLGRLMEMSVTGKWADFESAANELPESLGDPNRDRTIKLFQEMLAAIRSPDSASAHIDRVHRLLLPDSAEEEFLIDDFLACLPGWLAEISRRAMDQRLPYSEVKAIGSSADTLLEGIRIQGRRPIQLDALLMTAAVRRGPPFAADDLFSDTDLQSIAQIAANRVDENGVTGVIAKAIRIEQDPYNLSRQIRTWIQQDRGQEELAVQVSPEYVEYLKLIADGATASTELESGNRWDISGDLAQRMRAVLHPDRRRRIADVYLRVAARQSGVSDREVTRLRYAESDHGQQAVANASWWLENQSDPANDTDRRLEMEKMLLRIASARRNQQPLDDPSDIGELTGRLADSTTSPEQGQWYRAMFEVLRHKAGADGTSLTPAELNAWIRSAVAMCDLLNGNGVDRAAWRSDVLDPIIAAIQSHNANAIEPEWKFRFLNHYLVANDQISKIIDADPVLWSNLEFASAALATNDQLESQRRLELWLQASESLQQQLQTESRRWSVADLNVMAKYLREARAIDANDPVLNVHIAFGKFYMARANQDRARLLEAEKSLQVAIAKLQDSKDLEKQNLVHLYEAYWTHANLLVILAFEHRDPQEKKPLLARAHASANKAVELHRDEYVSQNAFSNGAWMALGNCCEDLAHYCSKDSITDQRNHFREAISAFEKAVKATKWDAQGSSMKPCYSLARCRYRFAVAERAHGDPVQAKRLWEQAKIDLGKFNDQALPITQMKWLAWSANIASELGDRKTAIDDMNRAYEFATDPNHHISERDRSQVIQGYARILSMGSRDDLVKAVEIIDQIESPDWPVIEFKCRWLTELEQDDRLLQYLGSIPDTRLAEFSQEPEAIAVHLAVIADLVRNTVQREEVDDQKAALKFLRELDDATFAIDIGGVESPTVVACRSIYRANTRSFDPTTKASERILGFITALRSTDDAKLEPAIVASLELGLLSQFSRDVESLESILGELTDRDRNECTVRLNHLGKVREPTLGASQVNFLQGLLRIL